MVYMSIDITEYTVQSIVRHSKRCEVVFVRNANQAVVSLGHEFGWKFKLRLTSPCRVAAAHIAQPRRYKRLRVSQSRKHCSLRPKHLSDLPPVIPHTRLDGRKVASSQIAVRGTPTRGYRARLYDY